MFLLLNSTVKVRFGNRNIRWTSGDVPSCGILLPYLGGYSNFWPYVDWSKIVLLKQWHRKWMILKDFTTEFFPQRFQLRFFWNFGIIWIIIVYISSLQLQLVALSYHCFHPKIHKHAPATENTPFRLGVLQISSRLQLRAVCSLWNKNNVGVNRIAIAFVVIGAQLMCS